MQGLRHVFAAALAVLAALTITPPSWAQVRVTSDATSIDIGGRLHVQTITSSCSSFDPGESGSACAGDVTGLDLFIRRARLEFDVAFNDWISGRFQPDFGEVDGVEIKDAYGLLNLNPAAENAHARIKIGRFKRPFDGFQLTSSTKILTIERDVDIPGVPGTTGLSLDELTTRNRLSDRDIGIMVEGSDPNARFQYWAGVFNGRSGAANEDMVTEKQFIGRARVNLAAGPHPLSIAGAVAVTDAPFEKADGTLGARYVANVEIFAELGDFGGGPHAQAGVVFGKNTLESELGGAPDLGAGDPLANMITWQVIGSWKVSLDESFYFVEAVEPLLRITMGDPNRDLTDDVVYAFTPGVQIFFDGRNKVALNWDYMSLPGGLDSESSFKAQYQFHF